MAVSGRFLGEIGGEFMAVFGGWFRWRFMGGVWCRFCLFGGGGGGVDLVVVARLGFLDSGLVFLIRLKRFGNDLEDDDYE
ncbi:hypothetical protein LWI28_024291 [Acer negundo]|uniref:Uncharacterized protein n=1 Tax=Acer negundo TaxID=4023 RepID=A0AAD5JBB8_ACENE|nr:hypothetical protein LWI28_024291 [Acer negundo]KAK4839510.1 hypothetical protein QYF36_022469 [Acer negundo]